MSRHYPTTENAVLKAVYCRATNEPSPRPPGFNKDVNLFNDKINCMLTDENSTGKVIFIKCK